MSTALEGLKVIEIGNAVSAPFCAAMMADFGASVIKIESPKGGDMLRSMGNFKDLWFTVENRNKKCITLNLKSAEGADILNRLLEETDILVENMRPGALARLGFGWETVHEKYPRLIMISISGYGQTGPYAAKPGFDRLGVAMGGLTYLTGLPDQEPVRPGFSIADYTTGAYALIGGLMALYYRDAGGTGVGQHIDASLYESILRMNECNIADYSYKGVVRERTGNRHPSTIPGGNFLTKDGQYLVLACGGEKLFHLFAEKIGRSDMLTDDRYATGEARIAHRDEINAIAADWIREHTLAECEAIFGDEVPNGAVYSVREIMEDPHIHFREDLAHVHTERFGDISFQGIYPKLSETPGAIRWPGGQLGQFNREIYMDKLGYSEQVLENMKEKGII